MAEYMHIIVFSGLATALFLGGWRGPGPLALGPLWVVLKMFLIVCFFIWARATFPRLRYDQLMAFGWKVLIPISLGWILMIATIRVFRQHGGSTPVYIVAGAIIAVLAALAWTGDVAAERKRVAAEADAEAGAGTAGAGGVAGPTGGAAEGTGGTIVPAASAPRSFPIPPMDLPHYHGVGVTVPAGERPPPSGASGDPGSTVNGTSKEVSGV
jgi:NADH-quinone oxidoreductase subunit H